MCIHPKRVFTGDEIKALDLKAINEFGMPGILLMENAGLGVAHFLLSQANLGKVIICCGPGNNGGDGLVVARHLFNHNVSVEILLFANPEKWSEEAKINYNIANKLTIPIHKINDIQEAKSYLNGANWIIDGLFGIGLKKTIQSPYVELINLINKNSAKVLAIDVPSGLDANTGKAQPYTIKADITLTFVGLKTGFLKEDAKKYLGEVRILDIGIPKIIL